MIKDHGGIVLGCYVVKIKSNCVKPNILNIIGYNFHIVGCGTLESFVIKVDFKIKSKVVGFNLFNVTIGT